MKLMHVGSRVFEDDREEFRMYSKGRRSSGDLGGAQLLKI